jgi:hypothetical protein
LAGPVLHLSSWAEHHFVVAAGLARVHHGRIARIVLGVGIGAWACIFEGLSSGGGDVSRSVRVVAAVSWCASEAVRCLAEAIEVGDGAAESPAMRSGSGVPVRVGGVDHEREIVSVLQALHNH